MKIDALAGINITSADYFGENLSLWINKSSIFFAVDENETELQEVRTYEVPMKSWGAMFLCLIILVSLVGNVMVCVAVSMDRKLQNMTNYFLMSLAVSDLLVATFVMPLAVYHMVVGLFLLPGIICDLWVSMDVLFSTASILHLCMLSFDRCLSLKYPLKYGRNKTKGQVAMKICVVWIISIIIAAPLFILSRQGNSTLLRNGMCFPNDKMFIVLSSIGSFYIPLVIMAITYGMTIRLLNKQAAKHKKGMTPKSYVSKQKNLEKKPRDLTTSTLCMSQESEIESENKSGVSCVVDEYQESEENPFLDKIRSRGLEIRRQESVSISQSSVSRSDDESPLRTPIKKSASENYSVRFDTKKTVNRFLTQSRSMVEGAENQDMYSSFGYGVASTGSPKPVRYPQKYTTIPADADGVEMQEYENSTYGLCRCGRQHLRTKAGSLPSVSQPNLLVQQPVPAKEPSVKKKGRHERLDSKFMHNVSAKSRNERKASQSLGIIFAVFMILWCPFFVSYVTKAVCPPCEPHITDDLMTAFTWLGYCSSMVNPFIYSMFNKNFRQAFGKILTCRWRDLKDSHSRFTLTSTAFA